MNHSHAMELIREANPVPNPAGMERRHSGTPGRIGKLTVAVLAALVLGAGASWAATGEHPVDLLVTELFENEAPATKIEAQERDMAVAPASAETVPVTESNEIRVPAGSPPAVLVEFCQGLEDSGVKVGEQNPQCAAVLLKHAGLITGDVFERSYIQNRYENWRVRQ
jgi:hypothetical protein